MTQRKGIVLAGGSGTRLYPITMGVSKQLLPIYDKPMIYYPLSVLMLAGIREICVITTPQDQDQFKRTMVDGSQWGLSLTYVVQPSPDGTVRHIVEKPAVPPSHYAVTGLYFLDGTAPERARRVQPSERGELEITSLLETYLDDGILSVQQMGRGYAWLDTGTHGSLLDAGNFVRTLSERQGQQVGCPEEIAFEKNWINADKLLERARLFGKTDYGAYLKRLATDAAK
jgi:dTDP-glucose pyrophosphorylase